MKTLSRMLALVGCLCACARVSPETAVINDAAEALGGKAHIQEVRTLTVEGEGTAPNLGQNITPDADLPVWKVTSFQRSIDIPNSRMRARQLREAQFLFAGATTQRQDVGIDGDAAYTVGADGMAVRASAAAARDRRLEMLHHPLIIVRVALDATAKVSNLRQTSDRTTVDVTTAAGEVLALEIDRATKLPVRVTSMSSNENLGDVAIETSFSDYETVSGVKLPKRLATRIDRYPQFDLHITKNAIDADAGDLAAPAAVRSASLPPAAAVTVTAQEMGKGIWWLAGSGNHRSILFEFADHLVLYEVPVSELRSKAVIDTARSLRPQKPLTHAVVSHHHFDHSGGLRVAVAEGLTIITYRGNVEFFKELVARKHTIVPDALERNPKPLKIEAVDEEFTLKDRSLEVQLYHLKGNPREGTNLFAYIARDGMLIQADMYDSTWMQHPWGDNLPYNLELHHLQVKKSVPVHGTVQTYAEVLQTIRSKQRL